MSRPSPAVGLNEWLGRTLSRGRTLCKPGWAEKAVAAWRTVTDGNDEPLRTEGLRDDRAGNEERAHANWPEAGNQDPHWNFPKPETTTDRERSEATEADEGLTP